MRAQRSLLLFGLAMAVCWCAACKDEDRAPAAPGSTGNSEPPPAGRPDSSVEPETDAGEEPPEDPPDEGLDPVANECRNVEPLSDPAREPPPGTFLNQIEEPPDLLVSRVLATWDVNCAAPVLVIEMSNGSCPNGRGHELEFRLDVNAIEEGGVVGGQNQLTETSGLTIRYRRTGDFDPEGVYGNCAGSSGTFDLVGAIELSGGSMLDSQFIMDLAPCDGSDNPLQAVFGTFSVELERGLEDICPSRTAP